MLAYLAVLLFLLSSPAATPDLSGGECVVVTGEMILADPAAVLVFSGRVVGRVYVGSADRPTYRATFEVDRIWKGAVPQRTDIYVSELRSEMPRFAEGRDYVVIASRVVDPKLRLDMGLSEAETPAFAAQQCSGDLPTDIRKQLGEGYRPK